MKLVSKKYFFKTLDALPYISTKYLVQILQIFINNNFYFVIIREISVKKNFELNFQQTSNLFLSLCKDALPCIST